MSFSAADLSLATQLTREGRLVEATQAIQRALSGQPPEVAPEVAPAAPKPAARPVAVEDVAYREVTRARPGETQVAKSPAKGAPSASTSTPSAFTSAHFAFADSRYRYRVYVPARSTAAALPVVVMLHGCKQDSEDFARGTAMNALAEREKFIVLYPEQLRKGNSMGCWNWFEPKHQRRDAGEPAMIAALTQLVTQQHGGDPARVYVAGLSAGGAMAALLGDQFPEVFAAVGVHSGLPARAARDMPSAFSAMRQGATGKGGGGGQRESQAIPTVVFYGSGDQTVSPRNGEAIVEGQLAAWAASGKALAKSAEDQLTAGRTALRTRWSGADGVPRLEAWSIEGSPHAWSGGDSAGSFTDPKGPDASAAMHAFFLQHRRKD